MVKSVGFPISNKENENRRAILPEAVGMCGHARQFFFQNGYGDVLGFKDEDYVAAGASVVSREETLACDIICDPKIGDADYLHELKGQTVFGWLHAVQNKEITDYLVDNRLTAFAWEDMFLGGRHCFYRNNQIAGEAAIMHAFQCWGDMPNNKKVALIGRGNTAIGALTILTLLGADITIFDRKMEALMRNEISQYDVLVNAVLWDTTRSDHIIYDDDLDRMKTNSMIVDVSCDHAGAIETSRPTTIEDPYYYHKGILHYVVDHTPSLFYRSASRSISEVVSKYLDDLVSGKENDVLEKAKIISDGIILDERINAYQNRT